MTFLYTVPQTWQFFRTVQELWIRSTLFLSRSCAESLVSGATTPCVDRGILPRPSVILLVIYKF